MIFIGASKRRDSIEFPETFIGHLQVVFKRMTMDICHPLSTVNAQILWCVVWLRLSL